MRTLFLGTILLTAIAYGDRLPLPTPVSLKAARLLARSHKVGSLEAVTTYLSVCPESEVAVTLRLVDETLLSENAEIAMLTKRAKQGTLSARGQRRLDAVWFDHDVVCGMYSMLSNRAQALRLMAGAGPDRANLIADFNGWLHPGKPICLAPGVAELFDWVRRHYPADYARAEQIRAKYAAREAKTSGSESRSARPSPFLGR